MSWALEDGAVKSGSRSTDQGVGLHAVSGEKTGFAYSDEFVLHALYVSPRQTIDQLLPQLRKCDDHMTVVVDEFGSAIGIITMDDIIEEVVGEIDVGYDEEAGFRIVVEEATERTAVRLKVELV